MCTIVLSLVLVVPEVATEDGVREVEIVAQLLVPALVHSEHLFCPVQFLGVVAGFHRALYFFEQLKETIDFSRSLVLCPLLHHVSELRLALAHVVLEFELGSLLVQFSLPFGFGFANPGLLQGFGSGFPLPLLLQLLVGYLLLLGEEALPQASYAGLHVGVFWGVPEGAGVHRITEGARAL